MRIAPGNADGGRARSISLDGDITKRRLGANALAVHHRRSPLEALPDAPVRLGQLPALFHIVCEGTAGVEVRPTSLDESPLVDLVEFPLPILNPESIVADQPIDGEYRISSHAREIMHSNGIRLAQRIKDIGRN